MASTSSSQTPPPPFAHDVFLSFRGADTRHGFTAHLYGALVRRGINAYRDDNELARGETIEPSLLRAIECSRFSIVVFSRGYAESPWCLDELAKIVDCRRRLGQAVLPVFYDVDPMVVAELNGEYGEALNRHCRGDSAGKVEQWKEALEEVGNVSGWDVQNKDQSEMVREIVDTIWLELSRTLEVSMDNLVGMGSRANKLKELLGEDTGDDVRFVGISGMGGIGKTTLARVVYDEMSLEFRNSRCFLENVKDSFEKHGAVHVQEHLLSAVLMEKNLKVWDAHTGKVMIKKSLQHRKVLLVLDDVDSAEQLEMLAANQNWFGPGSRIIITSRDQRLLYKHGACGVFKLEGLNYIEALTLFSLKTFKNYEPSEGFEEFSMRVVEYAQGLPLAIEVLGCFLGGRSRREWESAITSLKDYCDDILDVLKISFDGLNKPEKDMFLDIACFFNLKSINEVKKVLNSCGFCADIGVKHLVEKSLLSFSPMGKLVMHDLLRDMGRKIVHLESPGNPGRRSRLWDPEDILSVLTTPTGREEVEAIVLDLPEKEEVQLNREAFSNMYRLRLLIIRNAKFEEGPIDLPSELRFLVWDCYPSESLPASFRRSKLVELNMCYSNMSRLWHGKAKMSNLNAMDLSHSHNLIATPDFTGAPNIATLIFKDCTSLGVIHPSIGSLQKLTCLSFRGCTKLHNLPSMPGKLKELYLDSTALSNEELQQIICWAVALSVLSLSSCNSLKTVPVSIGSLKQLKVLNLHGCSQLDNVPRELGGLESLEELDLSGTKISQPPLSIFYLKHLKTLSFQYNMPTKLPTLSGLHSMITTLNLGDCGLKEGDFPTNVGCLLPSLELLDLSSNNFVTLPIIGQLSRLYSLRLDNCMMLRCLPKLPSRIEFLYVNGCVSLGQMPDMKFSGGHFYFEGLDCSKLYDENGVSEDSSWPTLLRRPLLRGQEHPATLERLVFKVQGSRIPKWFTHQRDGSSIWVSLPKSPDYDDMMGLALCCTVNDLTDGSHFSKQQLGSPSKRQRQHICFFFVSGDSIRFLLKGLSDGSACVGLSFEELPFYQLIKPGAAVEVIRCGYRIVSRRDIEDLAAGTSTDVASASATIRRDDDHSPRPKKLIFEGSRSLVLFCANDFVCVRVLKVYQVD
ncbi:unnamed protein product [Linum tenue]|uniref:ADP-ribosyl cyclase/cyclic ADP-ribose hydrolase n=1 Tax=Linum tenue TaxID=586396 RepID=A0AAV0SB65_9ROSI|nr:unnamed protein product [Linum tenue]